MQEIVGQNEDILFDLEQIKLATQESVKLSDEDKEQLEKLSLGDKQKKEDEFYLNLIIYLK